MYKKWDTKMGKITNMPAGLSNLEKKGWQTYVDLKGVKNIFNSRNKYIFHYIENVKKNCCMISSKKYKIHFLSLMHNTILCIIFLCKDLRKHREKICFSMHFFAHIINNQKRNKQTFAACLTMEEKASLQINRPNINLILRFFLQKKMGLNIICYFYIF